MSSAPRSSGLENGDDGKNTRDGTAGEVGGNSLSESALDLDSIRDVVAGALKEKQGQLTASRHCRIRENVGKALGLSQEVQASSEAEKRVEGSSMSFAESALEVLCKSQMKGRVRKMESVKRPPSGLSWVRLHRNMMVTETYSHDFFVPYLGETEAELKSSNELAKVLEPDGSSEEDESEIEDLTGWEEKGAGSRDGSGGAPKRKVGELRAQRDKGNSLLSVDRSRNKISTAIWDRAIKRVALRAVLEVLQSKLPNSVKGIIRDVFHLRSIRQVDAYKNCVQSRVNAWEHRDKELCTQGSQLHEILRLARKEEKTSASKALKSMSIPYFICRLCYTFCCVMHGVQEAKPAIEPLDRTRKDFGTKQVLEEIEEGCEDRSGGFCWCLKADKDDDQDSAVWAAKLMSREGMWSDVNAALAEGFTTFGNDPCRLSSLFRTLLPSCHADIRFTCSRVGFLLDQLFGEKVVGKAGEAAQPCRNRNMAKRGMKKSAKGKTRVPQSASEAMKRGKHIDYVPCRHEGECTKKVCSCVQSGILCEKYCGCNHARCLQDRAQLTCNSAFAGCQCKSSAACVTNSCICWSQGRECDPDRCRSCCDCKQNFTGKRLKWGCRNVGLRMNYKQRTYAGHSDVHGWGVFAATNIAKSEIVGEYVAEVIQQTDAEQRGRVYDETRYSFLFDITNEQALDSTRLGNKLRFCNHSPNPNCEPKVMRVGGDVRVGIYAKRDIAKNEELFFDYGYHKDLPYAWAQKGKEASLTRGKKGVRITSRDDDSDSEALPYRHKRLKLGRTGKSSIPSRKLIEEEEGSSEDSAKRASPDINSSSSEDQWIGKRPRQHKEVPKNPEEVTRANRRIRPDMKLGNGVLPLAMDSKAESESTEEFTLAPNPQVNKVESTNVQDVPGAALKRKHFKGSKGQGDGIDQLSKGRESSSLNGSRDNVVGIPNHAETPKTRSIRRRPRIISSDDSSDDSPPPAHGKEVTEQEQQLEAKADERSIVNRKRKLQSAAGNDLPADDRAPVILENGRAKKRRLSRMSGNMIARPSPPKSVKSSPKQRQEENGRIRPALTRINGKVSSIRNSHSGSGREKPAGTKNRGEGPGAVIVISDEEGGSSSFEPNFEAHLGRRKK